MKINGEPVELLTDFGALRAGDVVYYKPSPCEVHPHHRGLVIRKARGRCGRTPFEVKVIDYWELAPVPACAPSFARALVVSPEAVAERHIYRVANPPLASDDAEENRALDRRRLRKALAR